MFRAMSSKTYVIPGLDKYLIHFHIYLLILMNIFGSDFPASIRSLSLSIEIEPEVVRADEVADIPVLPCNGKAAHLDPYAEFLLTISISLACIPLQNRKLPFS